MTDIKLGLLTPARRHSSSSSGMRSLEICMPWPKVSKCDKFPYHTCSSTTHIYSLSILFSLRHHKEDIETLFQLLKVFLYRHITSFPFLKSYLENDVARDYTIEQKRAVFFKFVEVFSLVDYPQELKAKVIFS